jgi:signal transduction histidine kinase
MHFGGAERRRQRGVALPRGGFARRLATGMTAFRARIANEALTFAVLRVLMLTAGVAALFIVPLDAGHELHLAPLVVVFVAYNVVLLAALARWPEYGRAVFLAALGADLLVVFMLVWFTGGGNSHFYLLFFLLVALNAYYFGGPTGVAAAAAASALLAVANALAITPAEWVHIGSRAVILGILGFMLGHVATRERASRARAEQLDREVEAAGVRLARAEQLAVVGRFAAKMAHEVRNPLGAIALNVDMLVDAVSDARPDAGAERLDLLQAVRREVEALSSLTDEYLNAARLPEPRLERDFVDDLVTEVVKLLRPLAEQKGATLVTHVEHDLPTTCFDRALLRLAVRNLVKNAIEAVTAGGCVRVTTSAERAEVLITVEDDGTGIHAAVASRLFEPFFTTKERGTGLGLSVVDEIVRQHRGVLTWTSEVGAGTRFSIRLPRVDP